MKNDTITIFPVPLPAHITIDPAWKSTQKINLGIKGVEESVVESNEGIRNKWEILIRLCFFEEDAPLAHELIKRLGIGLINKSTVLKFVKTPEFTSLTDRYPDRFNFYPGRCQKRWRAYITDRCLHMVYLINKLYGKTTINRRNFYLNQFKKFSEEMIKSYE